jgi:predicted regulator of Ras-like GTPase activity (Roadblock/LC7/MglB family)
MQGKLSDMTVIDLIQHNCMEQKTARLTLTQADESAYVYFDGGNITHATYNNDMGEEVIYQIISWEDGDFLLETGIEAPEVTITNNWSGILLEGARRLDEDGIDTDQTFDQSLDIGQTTMAQKIETILEEMGSEITGHIASTVVGMDALNIASYSDQKVDIDLASAQMTLLIKLVDTSVQKLGDSEALEDNLLTTSNAYVLINFIPGNTHFLGIIADRKTAVLGNLRLMSKVYAKKIGKALPR